MKSHFFAHIFFTGVFTNKKALPYADMVVMFPGTIIQARVTKKYVQPTYNAVIAPLLAAFLQEHAMNKTHFLSIANKVLPKEAPLRAFLFSEAPVIELRGPA